MDTENPVTANWLRAAYDALLARELARPEAKLPLEEIKLFAADPRHSGRARRLALTLCNRFDDGFSQSLIPRLLDDPEFRGEAVDAALAAGAKALEQGDSETARHEFHKAFDHARDSQQVLRAAGQLAALGEMVSVPQQLGLIVDWWLLGPFEAPGFSGFEHSYPPENQQPLDLRARYSGAAGAELRWISHHAADPMGLVNLVQAIAPVKEAVGYAYAELDAPSELTGQLRAGADDNCTVWLNGEKVLARNQWLNGHRLDRFVAPVKLRAGRNTLLVKICQGPQHKDPQVPNNWSLQLRICDASGKGLPLRSVTAPPQQAAP